MQKQSRAKEKHERKGNLRHDQEISRREKTVQATDTSWFTRLLFQIAHEIEPRRLESRSKTEEQRGNQTNEEGYGQDSKVGVNMDDEGKIHVAEQVTERFQEKIVAPSADENPADAAEQGEKQTFAEQLANDAPAARTQRKAERNFLCSGSAAGE